MRIMASEIAKIANSKQSKRRTTNVVAPTSSAPGRAESTTTARSKPKKTATPVSAEVRRLMIAEAAYYVAERRGFAPGNAVEDWLLAEKQIDAALR